MGLALSASLNRQDGGPSDAPFGTSPSLGECQRWLSCLLLHWFHLLSNFVKGNGCSGFCNRATTVLLASTGGMPDRATRILPCRLFPYNAWPNARLAE